MSWDERLFGWFWRGARNLKRAAPSPEQLARTVLLADMSDRLAVLATALSARAVKVRAAEGVGGVAPSWIWLPEHMDLADSREGNERLYVLRTALAATAIRMGALPERALPAEVRAVFTALSIPHVLDALFKELPAVKGELETLEPSLRGLDPKEPRTPGVSAFVALLESMGRSRPCALSERIALAEELAPLWCRQGILTHPLFGLFDHGVEEKSSVGEDRAADALPKGTELRLRTTDRATLKELGDDREENPLVHSFEKLHTLEEHKGGRKRADGSDELEAHAEALQELQMTEVIRSNERAESLLRSDAMFESTAGDLADISEAEGLPYDEWDGRAQSFKPAWCRVRVGRVSERMALANAEEAARDRVVALARQIDATRTAFLAVRESRRPRLRELDGPDLDDDAMVDRHASLAAGSTPPDRLFVARRAHAPELAVLLLIDGSLSTDGWVDGRRVLDVERDAALVMAEALDGLVAEVAVASFHSQTRRDCRFDLIKGLAEPWARARPRLFNVMPAGYTRIGPAIRHGRTLLGRAAASRRLMIVVTDGKPNDYDRYEGSYGLDDVQHAVLEAKTERIHTHGLAIDLSARSNLPRMFGRGQFTLLRHPRDLPNAVGEVIAQMGR